MKYLHWQIGGMEDYSAIWSLLYFSPEAQKWSMEDIKHRVLVPLFSQRVLVFHELDKDNPTYKRLVGFITIATANEESEKHIRESILDPAHVRMKPDDWVNGKQWWILDFVFPYGHTIEVVAGLRKIVNKNVVPYIQYWSITDRDFHKLPMRGEGEQPHG